MPDSHLEMIRRVRAQIDALGSSLPTGRDEGLTDRPRIPNYEIIREIQRGGQGVVYLCRQTSTRREVALKLLLGGGAIASAERARFQREIEILAALRHPNVVTIHDSGSIGDRFFYAMEYIEGRPLDVFIAEQNPPVAARVQMFVEICEGVGAAHLRGVLHRDLKPGNIRVDNLGRCHVLDFGLARFAGDGDQTVPLAAMTQTGQFLGSLPWSSPEQVVGQRDEVDLRTDVYSLGVLLFQSLTGQFPYRVTGALGEVIEQIRTVEPPAPSRLNRQLNADLDTVVLKCLAKDRERRYSTAVELGRDLKRYLAGEPIEARRDSLAYVLRKQLRRHWLPAAVAGAFVLVIAAGLIATTTFWRQAVRDRERAEGAQRQAESEAARSKAALRFLNDQVLAGADPESGAGPDLTLREVLDAAASGLKADEPDEPLVAAAIHAAIGQAYRSLGVYDKAETHLETAVATLDRAAGPEHPDTIEALDRLAYLRGVQGRFEEEVALHQRVYDYYRGVRGEHHVDTLHAMNGLGVAMLHAGRFKEAANMLREAYERYAKEFGPEARDTLAMRNNLADVFVELDQIDEARELYDGLVEGFERAWGKEHPHTLSAMNNYATFLRDYGDTQEAEAVYLRAIELGKRVLGEDHPLTLAAMGNLASLFSKERLPEAEALQREVLAAMRNNPGPDHPNTLITETNLGSTLRDLGRTDDAEALYRDVIDRQSRVLEPHHPNRAPPLRHLANLLMKANRPAEAAPVQSQLVEIYRATLPEGDSRTLSAIANLGALCDKLNRPDEAGTLLREAAATGERVNGTMNEQTLVLKNNLAAHLRKNGRPEEAAALYRELVATLSEGDASWNAAVWRGGLGACLLELGRLPEAKAELRFALDTFESDPGENAAFIEATRERLAEVERRERQQ